MELRLGARSRLSRGSVWIQMELDCPLLVAGGSKEDQRNARNWILLYGGACAVIGEACLNLLLDESGYPDLAYGALD